MYAQLDNLFGFLQRMYSGHRVGVNFFVFVALGEVVVSIGMNLAEHEPAEALLPALAVLLFMGAVIWYLEGVSQAIVVVLSTFAASAIWLGGGHLLQYLGGGIGLAVGLLAWLSVPAMVSYAVYLEEVSRNGGS